jgi:hypothetical protein
MSSPRRAAALVLALAAPFAFFMIAPACSSSSSGAACVSSGTITVTVTNQDDVANPNVCNATVTIKPLAGGATSTFTPQGLDGSDVNCIYVSNQPPGSYTLNVTAPGYEPSGPQTIETTCVASSPSLMIGLIAEQGDTADAGSGEGGGA